MNSIVTSKRTIPKISSKQIPDNTRVFFNRYKFSPVIIKEYGYSSKSKFMDLNPGTVDRSLDGWCLSVQPFNKSKETESSFTVRRAWRELVADPSFIMLRHPIRETVYSKRFSEPHLFTDNDLKKRIGTLFYDDHMYLTFMHPNQDRMLKQDRFWSMGIWGISEWEIHFNADQKRWISKVEPGDLVYIPKNMVTRHAAITNSLHIGGKYKNKELEIGLPFESQ